MNDYRAYVENDYNSIYHFGVKGQRWGIRRYQNPDGSLTPEGKKRYLNPDGSLNERGRKELGRRYMKDRRYAGRIAGGALGTAAAAYYAKGLTTGTAKTQREIEKINKMHPERKILDSGTFVKDGKEFKDIITKVPKNAEEAKRLKDAGYYIRDHKGGWGPGGYDVYAKDMPSKFKDIDAFEVWKKGQSDNPAYYNLNENAIRVDRHAKKVEQLQNEGYHLVQNQPYRNKTFANPIAQEKINDLLKKESARSKKIVAGVIAAGIGATAIGLYIHHKGVQKRKAEMEKLLMGSDKSDSSVTKKVKDDWKNLSDKEFKAKYKVSKDTYAKRVVKYGDPYMNSPLAKIGKSLSKSNKVADQKGFTSGAPSMKDIRAQQNRQGHAPSIRETVEKQNSMGRAPSIVPNFITDNFSKAESRAMKLGGDYYVAYDPDRQGYIVRKRGK